MALAADAADGDTEAATLVLCHRQAVDDSMRCAACSTRAAAIESGALCG